MTTARITSTSSTARTSRTSSSSPVGTGIPVNRTLFADRGSRLSLSVSSTTPGADVEYYIANASFVHYVPLVKGFFVVTNTGIDYGEPFGHTTAIPPYRQFFGGGRITCAAIARVVSAPPTSSATRMAATCASRARTNSSSPMPAKWRSSARVSAFFDMGGVYETGSKLTFLWA